MIYHISFDFITFWSNKQDSVAFLPEIFKYIAATAIDQIWVTVSLSQTSIYKGNGKIHNIINLNISIQLQ